MHGGSDDCHFAFRVCWFIFLIGVHKTLKFVLGGFKGLEFKENHIGHMSPKGFSFLTNLLGKPLKSYLDGRCRLCVDKPSWRFYWTTLLGDSIGQRF